MKIRSLSFVLAATLFALLALEPQVLRASGLQRMAPNTRALFEEGTYLEISWANVSPDLSGSGGLLEPAGLGTGDLLEQYNMYGFAVKADLTCKLSYAIVFDQPFGVDTYYPIIATSGYSGTSSRLDAETMSGILAYRFAPRMTAYAGGRGQNVSADVSFPFGPAIGFPGAYSAVAERDTGFGFMAGVAYEIEDIKLRVAATYYSEIETTHATIETIGAAVFNTETELTTPQSVNLEFQSGIAENTLAFGSVRWVDWSSFAISPPTFTNALGIPLVEYTEDWITYTLGIGRRLNDRWAIAALVSWEPSTGQELTTLGPVDGRFSWGIAPSYTLGNMTITAGVNFIDLGEATNFAGTLFDGGDAVAVGVRVGWSL